MCVVVPVLVVKSKLLSSYLAMPLTFIMYCTSCFSINVVLFQDALTKNMFSLLVTRFKSCHPELQKLYFSILKAHFHSTGTRGLGLIVSSCAQYGSYQSHFTGSETKCASLDAT